MSFKLFLICVVVSVVTNLLINFLIIRRKFKKQRDLFMKKMKEKYPC